MRIAFPHPPGKGGPASFQRRLEQALKDRGHSVGYAVTDQSNHAVLVVGGTKKIRSLVLARLRKIPIIHRLDGIGWLHRKRIAQLGIKNFFYGEFANWLINLEHSFLANKVVYQSNFVRDWWQKSGWASPKNPEVIYNSVSLDTFRPMLSSDPIKLICIEGTLDYSPYAVELINQVNRRLKGVMDFTVYGGFYLAEEQARLDTAVDFRGRLDSAEIVSAYQRSIYLSLDVNAACPNTVIEALACGAPVVGFDTGALRELVPPDAGSVVPYGGDPWKLEFPDVDALVNAILNVKSNWDAFSQGARAVAEEKYGVDSMVNRYISIIEDAVAARSSRG